MPGFIVLSNLWNRLQPVHGQARAWPARATLTRQRRRWPACGGPWRMARTSLGHRLVQRSCGPAPGQRSCPGGSECHAGAGWWFRAARTHRRNALRPGGGPGYRGRFVSFLHLSYEPWPTPCPRRPSSRRAFARASSRQWPYRQLPQREYPLSALRLRACVRASWAPPSQ